MSKRACLLSGGAAHGAFQVGVLSMLGLRGKLGHQVWRGTSVGSVNGAFLYAPIEEQNDRGIALPALWEKEVQGSDSVYRMRFGGLLGTMITGKQALAETTPLLSILKRHWKGPVPGVSLGVTAVDELTGKCLEFYETDSNVPEKILASSSFPGVFDPVEWTQYSPSGARLKKSVLTDGGVRDIVPHRSVLSDTDLSEIDAIVCKPVEGGVLPLSPGKTYSVLDRMIRTAEIMADELFLGDIAALRAWASTKGKTLRIWAPPEPIETDALDFRPSFQKLLIERGRRVVQEALL